MEECAGVLRGVEEVAQPTNTRHCEIGSSSIVWLRLETAIHLSSEATPDVETGLTVVGCDNGVCIFYSHGWIRIRCH